MRNMGLVFGLLVAFTFSLSAFAQDQVETGLPASGEIAAEKSRIMDPERPTYFQLGTGVGFGFNLRSDKPLHNVNIAYNRNFSERFTGKIFGDLNVGSGDEVSRMMNFGVGTDVYLREVLSGYGTPYAAVDLGYSFVRNTAKETQEGAAVGAGLGFKFALARLNMDLNIHYTLLTAQISDDNPSVFATRLALNF